MNLHELIMKFTGGDIGERDERGGFVPHLTIARVKYVRNRDSTWKLLGSTRTWTLGYKP